jgi:hypothetical protein
VGMVIKDTHRQAAYLCLHALMAADHESAYFNDERVSFHTILAECEFDPIQAQTKINLELGTVFRKYFPNGEVHFSVDYESIDSRHYKLKITLMSVQPTTLLPLLNEMFLYVDVDQQSISTKLGDNVFDI